MSYYEDDTASGPPVVLLHGLGPTGSAYEVRGLFEGLRTDRAVLAPDLPGYGFSERLHASLDRDAHAAFLTELLEDVSRRYGSTIDLVVIGRTAEMAGEMIVRAPRLVRSLVVIAPEGFATATAADRVVAFLVDRAAQEPWSAALVHRLVTARPVLRRLLAARVRARPDEGLVRYANASAHEPRASVAILGALGETPPSTDLLALYETVPVPTCFVLGEGDEGQGAALAMLSRRVGFSRRVVRSTRSLPHVERALMTSETLRAFWKTVTPRPQLRVIRGERSESIARSRLAPRKRARRTSEVKR